MRGVEIAVGLAVDEADLDQNRRHFRVVQEKQIISQLRATIDQTAAAGNGCGQFAGQVILRDVEHLGAEGISRMLVAAIEMDGDIQIAGYAVVPVDDGIQVRILVA